MKGIEMYEIGKKRDRVWKSERECKYENKMETKEKEQEQEQEQMQMQMQV